MSNNRAINGIWVAAALLATAYIVFWAMTPQLAVAWLSDPPGTILRAGAIIKAAPIALFAIIALSASKKHLPGRDHGTGRAHATLVGTGLMLSIVGDLCLDLEVEHPSMFLGGVGFFLLAHVAYAAAFARHGLARAPFAAVCCIALPITSLSVLWTGIPEPLRLYVTVYSCVIAAMAYSAASARLGAAASHTLAGAALFVLSDSLLAGDRFGPPALRIPQPKLAVMVTYYAAQALITSGAVAATAAHAGEHPAAPRKRD